MFSREERNQARKEKIKQAFAEKDIIEALKNGVENVLDMFISYLCNDNPITFQAFLDATSKLFDVFILDVSKQENLHYIGGKMFMEMANSTQIKLSADFYFQNSSSEWILKRKAGHIESKQFSDWETETDLIELRETKKLEFPIDPPTK